jgi:hypothetical protein
VGRRQHRSGSNCARVVAKVVSKMVRAVECEGAIAKRTRLIILGRKAADDAHTERERAEQSCAASPERAQGAGSWNKERLAAARIEIALLGLDICFICTNLDHRWSRQRTV